MSIWVLRGEYETFVSKDRTKVIEKFIAHVVIPYFRVQKVEEYLEDFEPEIKSYLELDNPDPTKIPTVSERDLDSLFDMFNEWELVKAKLLE